MFHKASLLALVSSALLVSVSAQEPDYQGALLLQRASLYSPGFPLRAYARSQRAARPACV
jgi:hypothetical protein